jgi:hypothetical protein
MTGANETGMDLLIESASTLDLAASACESPADAAYLNGLADRIRSYLAMSRPTTTLGMRRILSEVTRLGDEDVIHRTEEFNKSHVRIMH